MKDRKHFFFLRKIAESNLFVLASESLLLHVPEMTDIDKHFLSG